VKRELGAAGRAIAPELRTAWLVALRADRRRAVRNMVEVEKARRGICGKKRLGRFDDVQVKLVSSDF
jgi:hypothetical protein